MTEESKTPQQAQAPPPAGGHESRREGGDARGGAAAERSKRRRGRFIPRRRVCFFCANKDVVIDYKDVTLLRRFLSDRAKIEPRRKMGTCAKHQRKLSAELKRARHLALLPFTAEHIRLSGALSPRT